MTFSEQAVLDDIRAAEEAEQEGQTVVLYFKNRTEAEMAIAAINSVRNTV